MVWPCYCNGCFNDCRNGPWIALTFSFTSSIVLQENYMVFALAIFSNTVSIFAFSISGVIIGLQSRIAQGLIALSTPFYFCNLHHCFVWFWADRFTAGSISLRYYNCWRRASIQFLFSLERVTSHQFKDLL